jgi:hypothetical protein
VKKPRHVSGSSQKVKGEGNNRNQTIAEKCEEARLVKPIRAGANSNFRLTDVRRQSDESQIETTEVSVIEK